MNIYVRNFQRKLPVNSSRIKKIISAVFSAEKKDTDIEITVSVVTGAQIHVLNKKYLNHDYPTDVLAFNLSGGPCGGVADIIVASDTAVVNAKKFRTTPSYELMLYIIHGLLHILGYDDTVPSKRVVMRKKEVYYVKKYIGCHQETSP
ncbi:MAG: rRNA maturation RNase YbeY [Candidatus Omnitrophica bacterium]|nr:rRNA maturation RNase YbeY [Candidatus Omnitrophota bacterium]